VKKIWGSGVDDIFAVGYEGAILHYDGARWQAMTSNTTRPLRSVWGTAGNNVYAVGDIGALLHYDGRQWRQVDLDTYEGLRSVWGRGPDDIYVTGREGGIHHYDGSFWSALASPVASSLNASHGIGDALLVVGDGGVIAVKGALPTVEYMQHYLPLVVRG